MSDARNLKKLAELIDLLAAAAADLEAVYDASTLPLQAHHAAKQAAASLRKAANEMTAEGSSGDGS